MAEDVIVTFGASTAGLTDSLEEARAATKAAADDIAASAAQVGTAFAAMGKDESAATAVRLSGDIQIMRQGLSEQLKLIGEQTKAHEMGEDQKRAATLAALQAEYQAESQALDQESRLGDLSLARAQSIANRKAELELRYRDAVVNLNQQAVNAQAQQWESLFSTIEGAFNSQLRGLLAGTTNWHTAFKNILADLVIKFIEMCEKMAVQWAVGEIAQTAATNAGVAARTSATAAGAATGLVAMVRSVAASAAETFAGIFGFLAPIMGPAAAGPAAAGQATVAAAGSAVPSFDVGAWSVPADTLAMVHAGETIIPAGPAAAFRNAMSGGGGNSGAPSITVNHATHFNVQALDSGDVKRWFKNNSKTIMGAVNQSISNGAHLGFSKLGG